MLNNGTIIIEVEELNEELVKELIKKYDIKELEYKL